MDFINPGILFGLAAASIPLLLHFLNRSRSKNIPFSTLQFLKELQQQKIKRLKIRQLLLLLLRTLIIILLVLTFARPTLRGPLSGLTESNARSSMVIILDNSASMNVVQNGATLFEIAREKAAGLADAAGEGDAVYLLMAADTSVALNNVALTSQDIAEQIRNAPIQNFPADIPAALQKAQHVLERSTDVNREIYLIGDLQRYGFTDTISVLPGIRTWALPVRGKHVQNAAVSATTLLTTLLQSSHVAELRVNYTNSGEGPLQNTLAELFVENEKAAQSVLQIPRRGETSGDFNFVPDRTGFISAYIQLEQDDWDFDNRRYMAFYVPATFRTAIVSQNPPDADLVALALRPGQADSRFSVERVTPDALPSLDLENLDVLMLVNLVQIDTDMASRIADFVRAGGGLVLVLGENTRPVSFNSFLTKLDLPGIASQFGGMAAEQSAISVGYIDLQHPLFYGMFEDANAGFSRPEFNYALFMDKGRAIDRIMNYSTGDPLLFAKGVGAGRVAVLTTGINPKITDLSRRTIFAPLMDRLVQYTGAKFQVDSMSVLVGDALGMQLPLEHVNDVLDMERPDGTFDHMEPVITPSGPRIGYRQTQTPGIYTLKGNNKPLMVWAVNPDPGESDLTMIDTDSLKIRYGAELLDPDVDFVKFIRQNRYGIELWFWFALAALVLLLIEMIMFRSGSGDETR